MILLEVMRRIVQEEDRFRAVRDAYNEGIWAERAAQTIRAAEQQILEA